ncbi:TetR/AcrR family transcriptional regulator [Geothrix sp. 21YS21S-2]|uniref:TetR/AcrR family transcriptional regulator n=1 Tax=Geothrix sp. 21YS21S-2 TaxID=3068893 RepID=UPI0027B9E30E|nr:TetR family transcriptional regulator [Geothrix sp. 21YS21S-2]
MDAPTPTPNPDTRDSLLDAALACFAKYGYDATSIRLIASLAGKNSSLISYYFKSKEGLYRDVFKHMLARFQGCEPVDPPETPLADPRERLNHHFRRLLRQVEEHLRSKDPLQHQAARLFMAELHGPKDEVKDLILARIAPAVAEIRACLCELRPGLTEPELAFWGITLQGMCMAHSVHSELNKLVWPNADHALSLEEMADRLTDFACKGLGAPGPIPHDPPPGLPKEPLHA